MLSTTTLVQLHHICQIVLCLNGARHSYAAITRLQKYEATTKKLAKWSKEVEFQLYRTRTTQAAGAAAILATLLASIALGFFARRLPLYVRVALTPVVLVGVLAARSYVRRYWTPQKGKDGRPLGTKVPLPNMDEYNNAVLATEELVQTLEYIEYSLVASILVAGVIGYR